MAYALTMLALAWGLGMHARVAAADRALFRAVEANVEADLPQAATLGARAHSLAPHEVAYGRYATATSLAAFRATGSAAFLEAARDAARRTVASNPLDAGSWRLLAQALDATTPGVQGKPAEAAHALSRAAQLDPYNIVGTGIR